MACCTPGSHRLHSDPLGLGVWFPGGRAEPAAPVAGSTGRSTGRESRGVLAGAPVSPTHCQGCLSASWEAVPAPVGPVCFREGVRCELREPPLRVAGDWVAPAMAAGPLPKPPSTRPLGPAPSTQHPASPASGHRLPPEPFFQGNAALWFMAVFFFFPGTFALGTPCTPYGADVPKAINPQLPHPGC